MKNAAKKLCLTVGGIIMGSMGQLNADILPISPENGSTVSLHNARQKAFLESSPSQTGSLSPLWGALTCVLTPL